MIRIGKFRSNHTDKVKVSSPKQFFTRKPALRSQLYQFDCIIDVFPNPATDFIGRAHSLECSYAAYQVLPIPPLSPCKFLQHNILGWSSACSVRIFFLIETSQEPFWDFFGIFYLVLKLCKISNYILGVN